MSNIYLDISFVKVHLNYLYIKKKVIDPIQPITILELFFHKIISQFIVYQYKCSSKTSVANGGIASLNNVSFP
jgi:hypothetical protein